MSINRRYSATFGILLFSITQFGGCGLHEFVPKAFINEDGEFVSEGLADPSLLSFSDGAISIVEGQVVAAVVDLAEPAPKDIQVQVNLQGSATPTDDYVTNLAGGMLQINEGDSFASIVFTTADDPTAEPQEQVTATLVDNADVEIVPGSGTFVLTINDNDSQVPEVTLAAGIPVPEMGTQDVTANLDVPAPSAFIVPYNASGTATEGVDYTLTGTSFRFNAGDMSATVTINVVDDVIDEPNETIIFDLQAAGAGEYTLGAEDQATYTIQDDDAPAGDDPVVSIVGVTPNASPDEGVGSITVAVNIDTTPTNDDLTVMIEGLNGTAIGGGQDFTAAAEMLTFPMGQAPQIQNFTVMITDDGLVELDEDFTVTLRSVTGGTINPGAEFVDITIEDNDVPEVRFITNDLQHREPDEPAIEGPFILGDADSVLLVLDQAHPTLPITITYSITGTAQIGTQDLGKTNPNQKDYLITTQHNGSQGTVVIPAGQTVGRIQGRILDDCHTEIQESIVLTVVSSVIGSGPAQTTVGTGVWPGFIRPNADDCSGGGFEVDPIEGEPLKPGMPDLF